MRIGCALILCFMSLFASAQHELEFKYMRINQDLFGTIEFPMDAVSIGYAYVTKWGIGIRGDYGKSTETANSLFVAKAHYSNKINSIYSGTLFYRHDFNEKFSGEIGMGITDYKSTWKVDDEPAPWSDGADSDESYHIRIYYDIEPNVRLMFGYSDIYRKDKVGFGREETKGFLAGIVYVF